MSAFYLLSLELMTHEMTTVKEGPVLVSLGLSCKRDGATRHFAAAFEWRSGLSTSSALTSTVQLVLEYSNQNLTNSPAKSIASTRLGKSMEESFLVRSK